MAPDQVLSLRDVLRIFFRHRWKILGVFGVVFGGTLLYTVLRIPIYESQANVLVKLGPAQMSGMDNVPGGAPNLLFQQRQQDIHNELEILKSTELTDEDMETIFKGVEEAEARQRSRTAGAVRFAVRDVLFAMRDIAAWPLTKIGLLTPMTQRERLIEALEGGLRLEPLQDSDVIRVGFRWSDPQFAADLANLLVVRYQQHHARVHQQSKSLPFYDSQISQQGAKLDAIESALDQLWTGENVADLELQKELLLRDLSRLETKLTDVHLDLETVLAKQRAVLRLRDNPEAWIETPELAEGVSDLETLDKLFFQLKADRTSMADSFKADSRQLRRIDEQIESVRNQKAASVMTILRIREKGRVEQANGLEAEIERKRTELADLNARTLALMRLNRERTVAEQAYVLYRQKGEELRIATDLTNNELTNVALINSANAPRRAVWPRKPLLLGFGALIGLLLGFVYAIVLELTDHTFQDPESVAEVLDLPVLASVPDTEDEAWSAASS